MTTVGEICKRHRTLHGYDDEEAPPKVKRHCGVDRRMVARPSPDSRPNLGMICPNTAIEVTGPLPFPASSSDSSLHVVHPRLPRALSDSPVAQTPRAVPATVRRLPRDKKVPEPQWVRDKYLRTYEQMKHDGTRQRGVARIPRSAETFQILLRYRARTPRRGDGCHERIGLVAETHSFFASVGGS
jgi:hypothetical protein